MNQSVVGVQRECPPAMGVVGSPMVDLSTGRFRCGLHLAHRQGNAWAVFRNDKARTSMRSLFL